MPVKEYLEMVETERLEEAATCLRDKLLFMLPRRLGCRISEVLGVRVEDIDFKQRRITIQHLKTHIDRSCPHCGARLTKAHTKGETEKGKLSFCPGCGTRVEKAILKKQEQHPLRNIPADLETLKSLKAFIDGGGPVSRDNHQFIFNICRQRAWQIYREYCIRLGIPEVLNLDTGKIHHFSPHKMRDSFATNWATADSSDDNMRLLQEQLGHKEISTTFKYRKVAGKELEDRYKRIMGEEDSNDS